MKIPVKEIEYLASFVEADTENDLYEISEAVMAQVNIVREWLKTVEHALTPDGLKCPVCQQVAGTYLACSYCHSAVTPAKRNLLGGLAQDKRENSYTFTGDELTRLLEDTIGLAFEYVNHHDKNQAESIDYAIVEVFESIDASQQDVQLTAAGVEPDGN